MAQVMERPDVVGYLRRLQRRPELVEPNAAVAVRLEAAAADFLGDYAPNVVRCRAAQKRRPASSRMSTTSPKFVVIITVREIPQEASRRGG